jgi:hypothetical protein
MLVLTHDLADGGGTTLVANVPELLAAVRLHPLGDESLWREEEGPLSGQLVVHDLPARVK